MPAEDAIEQDRRLERLHEKSGANRETVPASARCGCFYCLEIYPSKDER